MNLKRKIGGVVIGGDFQALGVIRSLREEGVPVFLVEHEWSISRYSRFVNGRVCNEELVSGEVLPGFLIDLAIRKNLQGWVLYPNNDELVKILSQHREKLNEYYRNPVPPWETVKKFYIKREAYEIAAGLDIPIPRRYAGNSLDEILAQEISYPIVLKPSFKENYFPKTRKKAIRVADREGLIREYRAMAELVDPPFIVVQELLEGGPKNLFSYVGFFDGNDFVAGMAAIRRRQHPMDFGQATTYAISVHLPELRPMATRILRKIGYYGLVEVEFMKDDKDGIFKFLEINGRQWGWHTLTKIAGFNLPYYLYLDMIGEKIPPVPEPEIGVKWIRCITDVPTVFKELVSGRMTWKEYLESFEGKKEDAVFSLKDPLPFFMEYLMIPYLWMKRGF